MDELTIKTPPEDHLASGNLNSEQAAAYNIILDHVHSNKNGIFSLMGLVELERPISDVLHWLLLGQ